ncbi:NAD(P)-dependent oxidoreductase [Anaeromyxobacter paludicola]|uniref:3-hydroxyisobutyrate dehydrogenase n=1 Tax=Anaeromyxobacter paludicola TaxID=2918171 RepID=A0ABM7XE96_9BACT|nr:NAD(P)-dependent oxidoreductase [Anaeromyxobacter paludicola]BDG10213.1 3-hydroxyisobutyrate dehydrogenase [Anaeromyxobacter paludicola]
MDVGFVGLGAMGQGMARSLLRAGHRVSVWNRSPAKAEALAGEGAQAVRSPAEAARGGLAITMVADDAALEAVTSGEDGVRAGLPRGGLHLSMSTVSPATTARLAKAHAAAGQALLAAPVFGRPDAAAAAKLFVLAAGPADALERARPLLEAMGQRVFPLGDDPAHASLVKLTGNFLITTVIEALAEACALVEKGGIPPARLVEILTQSLFAAPVYQGYGKTLVEERFSPAGFALPLGAKDNRLLLQAAEAAGVPMPLASLVRDRMIAALARGWADLDWSSFGRLSREDAGLAKGPPARAGT